MYVLPGAYSEEVTVTTHVHIPDCSFTIDGNLTIAVGGDLYFDNTTMSVLDVFVQANRVYEGREEGQGISLIEASGSGKPVVATRTGGVPDVVADGRTGYIVEPEKPVELAEKIRILLLDRAVADKMGVNGRRLVEERFNIRINAVRMLSELDG